MSLRINPKLLDDRVSDLMCSFSPNRCLNHGSGARPVRANCGRAARPIRPSQSDGRAARWQPRTIAQYSLTPECTKPKPALPVHQSLLTSRATLGDWFEPNVQLPV